MKKIFYCAFCIFVSCSNFHGNYRQIGSVAPISSKYHYTALSNSITENIGSLLNIDIGTKITQAFVINSLKVISVAHGLNNIDSKHVVFSFRNCLYDIVHIDTTFKKYDLLIFELKSPITSNFYSVEVDLSVSDKEKTYLLLPPYLGRTNISKIKLIRGVFDSISHKEYEYPFGVYFQGAFIDGDSGNVVLTYKDKKFKLHSMIALSGESSYLSYKHYGVGINPLILEKALLHIKGQNNENF